MFTRRLKMVVNEEQVIETSKTNGVVEEKEPFKVKIQLTKPLRVISVTWRESQHDKTKYASLTVTHLHEDKQRVFLPCIKETGEYIEKCIAAAEEGNNCWFSFKFEYVITFLQNYTAKTLWVNDACLLSFIKGHPVVDRPNNE